MGKRSTKENKNPYQVAREEAGLTREAAAERLYMSPDRVVRIERDGVPKPDEVVIMAKEYKAPLLRNYFCSRECAIGQEFVPEIRLKHLSQIILETLSALNACNREKERLIEIAADGKITEEELCDFKSIQENLNALSTTIDTLKYWADQAIAAGTIESRDND